MSVLEVSMETRKSVRPLPSVGELLLGVGLYDGFDLQSVHSSEIDLIRNFAGPLDAYCSECNDRTTFRQMGFELIANTIFKPPKSPMGPPLVRATSRFLHLNSNFQVELVCTRDVKHKVRFMFEIHGNVLYKVGQYPSISDFQTGSIDKYKRVLSDPQRKEFSRAIGLFAHGIGIGSFVYLRRIFDSLIEEGHAKAKEKIGWDEREYLDSRTNDRIKMLRGYLPELLVENAKIYSILSAGIHQLDEDKCIEYFETLRLGIETILDEKIREEEFTRKRKALGAEVARIEGHIGKEK